MRNVRDEFAKSLLDLLLSPHGVVRTEAAIRGTDTQRADLLFVPRHRPPRAWGLLGRIARRPATFEHFSAAPDVDEALACLRKLLTWRHLRAREKRRADATAWMLCAATPVTLLRALDLRATPRWPRGIYGTGIPLRVIALDELPRTPDTALLRLLGSDALRHDATRELDAAGDAVPHLDEVRGLLVQFAQPRSPTEEDDAMAVDLSRYHAWKEQNRAEGRAEGLAHGRILGAVEARLRRALTDDELARFERRLARDGRDAVHQRALALEDADLARWVAGKRVRTS